MPNQHTVHPRSPAQRFFAKVEFTDTCWLWTASKDKDGYGRFFLFHPTRRQVAAHRWLYEFCVGDIPEGRPQLDHVLAWGCTNRHCVNPDHLEPVTGTENAKRTVGRAVHANAHEIAGGEQ